MTTSNTYAFNPSMGELGLFAFNSIGIRSAALLQEHMQSLVMAANLMLSRWSNQGVNLWKVQLVTVPLVQGTATYAVDPKVIIILDAYVTSGATNRTILPISRTEYSTYPNPAQQGFTTVFWMDRLISPTVTLWPVPDGTSAQSLSYYAVTQVQDANLPGGQTVDVPYRWLDAFAAGLTFRLAKIWAPALAPALKGEADEAYMIAADQDQETANMYISPQLSGYYRN